jgi:pimeloyl-ACP methyl ester carboxylesterase
MDFETFEAGRAIITTTAGDISYVAIGDGPTALFLHGVGTNAHLWRNVIGLLAAERRCVAIDLPLHGHSPAGPATDLTLGGLATAVAAFCDALALVELDVVANDTGGAVAQIFAATQPPLIRTLTLTNCETHDNVPPPAFQATVDLARAGGIAPNAPALLADLTTARAVVFAMGYEDQERLNIETVRCFLQPVLGTEESARQFERLLASLCPDDLLAVEPALARLDKPTLVVWGADDPMFDVKWAYWLRDNIAGAAEVVELPGGKLFFPHERADDLVPLLRAHWLAADHRAPVTS